MKKAVLALLAGVLGVSVFSASAVAAEKVEKIGKKEATVLNGTLAVVKDEQGKPTGTTLTTSTGQTYTLSGLTQNVKSLDGKEVTVKGEVTEKESGEIVLAVRGRIKAVVEKKEKHEKKERKHR